MELPKNELKPCLSCANEIATESNFCKFCGAQQEVIDVDHFPRKKQNLIHLAIFFGVELFCCISARLIKVNTIGKNLFFDFAMALSAVLFFASSWTENKHLLKWPTFSLKKVLAIVVSIPIISFLIQYVITALNHNIFESELSYYAIYADHPYGKYIMVVSIALFPALFEELAYRGYLMQKLLIIVDEKQAIYISSIVFFLMHFSLVSFFWMLPFAFLLGYIRMKENTIWYGVLIHFLFNFTACIYELYLNS